MCRKYSSLKINWFQAICREKLWPLISGQRQKLRQKLNFGKRNRSTESRKALRCCTWCMSAPPAAATGGQPRFAAGSSCSGTCSKFHCAAGCAHRWILQSMAGLLSSGLILLVYVKYQTWHFSCECGREQGGRILCTHNEPIMKFFLVLKQFFHNMWSSWPSAALRWEESLKTMIITVFTNVISENLISSCTSFLKFLSSSCSLSFSVQAKPMTLS